MPSLPSSGTNWWGKSLYKAGRVRIALSQPIYPPILINPPGRERAFMAGAELQELLQMVENLNITEGLEELEIQNEGPGRALATYLADRFLGLYNQIRNTHHNPTPTRNGILHQLQGVIFLLRNVGVVEGQQINEEVNGQDNLEINRDDEAFIEAKRQSTVRVIQIFTNLNGHIANTHQLIAIRTEGMELLNGFIALFA